MVYTCYLCGNATGLTHLHVSVTATLETVHPPPAAPGAWAPVGGYQGPGVKACGYPWQQTLPLNSRAESSGHSAGPCGLPWVYHCGLMRGDQEGALNVPDS